MKVELKKTQIEDAERFALMQKGSFLRHYEKYNDKENPCFRTAEHVKRWLTIPERFIFNIIADGIFCGGLIIIKKDNQIYYLMRIFVVPEMQNKRIAQKAIKEAELLFPDAEKWELEFPVDLIANKKCYENCGYSDTGKREKINEKLTLAYYQKQF